MWQGEHGRNSTLKPSTALLPAWGGEQRMDLSYLSLQEPLHKDDGKFSQSPAFFSSRSSAPRPLLGKTAQVDKTCVCQCIVGGGAGTWGDGVIFSCMEAA